MNEAIKPLTREELAELCRAYDRVSQSEFAVGAEMRKQLSPALDEMLRVIVPRIPRLLAAAARDCGRAPTAC